MKIITQNDPLLAAITRKDATLDDGLAYIRASAYADILPSCEGLLKCYVRQGLSISDAVEKVLLAVIGQ